jgi:hypothetical protein
MLFLIEVHPDARAGRARYWRPDSCGYTDEVTGAGLYREDEARRIVEHSDRATMIPALPALTAAYDALQRQAAQVRKAMAEAGPSAPPCSVETPEALPTVDDDTLACVVGGLLGLDVQHDGALTARGEVIASQVKVADGQERARLLNWVRAAVQHAGGQPVHDVDLARKPWPLVNIEAALRAFTLAEREAEEARRTAQALRDCPGEGKCHGAATWCDICGDVDETCDDLDCDVHHPVNDEDDAPGDDWPRLDETVARVCADYGLGRHVTIHATDDGPVRRVQFQSDTPGTHTFVQRNTPVGFTVEDVRTNGVPLRRPFLAEGENAARALDALCRVKDLGALVDGRTENAIDEASGEAVGTRTFFTTDRGVEYEAVLRHTEHTVEVVAFQPTGRPN